MYLLVDNYDSFTYNLYALLKKNKVEIEVIKNNQFIDAEKYQGIILSPGPSNPSNSGTTLKYIEKYLGEKPIFGVCLGMQAIAYYLGFKVKKAKTIMHGKIDTVIPVKKSILFNNLEEFEAVRYHSLAVDIERDNKLVTAVAGSDSEIMAIEDYEKNFFAVQFHPESYLSEKGNVIIENFLRSLS